MIAHDEEAVKRLLEQFKQFDAFRINRANRVHDHPNALEINHEADYTESSQEARTQAPPDDSVVITQKTNKTNMNHKPIVLCYLMTLQNPWNYMWELRLLGVKTHQMETKM